MSQLSNYIYIKYLDGLCFKDGQMSFSSKDVSDFENRGSKKTHVKIYEVPERIKFLITWKKNLEWRLSKTHEFYKEKIVKYKASIKDTDELIDHYLTEGHLPSQIIYACQYKDRGLNRLHWYVKDIMKIRYHHILEKVSVKERKIYLMNSIKHFFPQWVKDLAKVGIIALYVLTACIALFVEWAVNKSINAIRLHRIRSPKDMETVVSMRKHLVFCPGKEDLQDKMDGILYDYNELKTSS